MWMHMLMTVKELAEHFAEEGIYPAGVTEQILPYLDYDLLARDLSMDYTEIGLPRHDLLRIQAS